MRKHPQTVFGLRLRQAREAAGIPQDRLGVMIGLDEGCSSARMSRYETGAHQPPYEIAEKISAALNVPVEYLYCRSDAIAALLLTTAEFTAAEFAVLQTVAQQLRDGISRGGVD